MGVVVVLARWLSPEAFGLVALAATFTTILQAFVGHGLGQAIVQASDLRDTHLDTAFWISVFTSVVLTVLAVLAAPFLAVAFDQPLLVPIVRWLSISLILGALSTTHQAILQRRFEFRRLAFRSLVAAASGGVVGIGMASAGFGIWSLVGQSLIGNLFGVLFLWRTVDWRPGLRVSFGQFRGMFSFGAHVTGSMLLGLVNQQFANPLIGYFLGSVELGFYSLAARLVFQLNQAFASTVASVALPTFSRLQHEPDQMRAMFLTATRMSCLAAFPMFLGLAAVAPDLIIGLIGPQWTPSVPVVQILALVGVQQAVFHFVGPLMRAAGRPSWILTLAILNTVVDVAVSLVVICQNMTPQAAIAAIAIVPVVRAAMFTPLVMRGLGEIIHLRALSLAEQCWRPLAGSVAMVLVVASTRHVMGSSLGPRSTLALCVIIGVLVYALFIRMASPRLAKEAWELFQQAIPRRVRRI